MFDMTEQEAWELDELLTRTTPEISLTIHQQYGSLRAVPRGNTRAIVLAVQSHGVNTGLTRKMKRLLYEERRG